MDDIPATGASFDYTAQDMEGRPQRGAIEAISAADAHSRLQAMGLRVLELATARPKPIRGAQFAAFNQQLAHLTAAGLPVERGLRLIAQDMPNARVAATIRAIADDLDRGMGLSEAFEKHRAMFPAMYGQLIAAGVASGDLTGVLLNLSSHLEMSGQLRQSLWRTLSYPAMVILAVMGVLTFMGYVVVPPLRTIMEGMGGDPFSYRSNVNFLPMLTRTLFAVSQAMPWILGGTLLLVVLVWIGWRILRAQGGEEHFIESFILPLWLIGPVLKLERIARWCAAMRIGVSAGLDLPTAFDVAGQTTRSPKLIEDGRKLRLAVEAGGSPDHARGLKLVPPTVLVAMQFATAEGDLPHTLETLSGMYREQAEHRLAVLNAVLQPLLLVLIGLLVALMMGGLFGVIRIIVQLTGPINSVM